MNNLLPYYNLTTKLLLFRILYLSIYYIICSSCSSIHDVFHELFIMDHDHSIGLYKKKATTATTLIADNEKQRVCDVVYEITTQKKLLHPSMMSPEGISIE